MSSNPFSSLAQSIIDYFPSLLAGIVLLILGVIAGWIIKRIVVQICVLLRVERILGSFRWGEEFSKADIRYALFNASGNTAFFLVFLVFLNAALAAMQLTILSNLIERGVLIIPRLLVSLIILGAGWFIARWVAVTVRRGLGREGVPRASLVARFSNAVVMLFFTAMALVELDVAREVVIIGFSVIIATLGVLTVAVVIMGGKDLVKKNLLSSR
jgi:hypothetical protein